MCLLGPALTTEPRSPQGNAATSRPMAASAKGATPRLGCGGPASSGPQGAAPRPQLQGTQRSGEARLALLWEGGPSLLLPPLGLVVAG